MNDDQWNVYANFYNECIGPEGDNLHKKYIDPIILNYLGNISRKIILDAACGNGYLLSKLSSKCKKIVGLDSSDSLLKYSKFNTKALKNLLLIRSDLTKTFPLKSRSFDIVIASMVLQYLPSLKIFARETSRILKKTGMLIIVIDSPLHSLFLRAQYLLGKKDKKLFQLNSYFIREKRRKKTLADKVFLYYYHRPIMDYINSFTPYFHLVHIDENTEDGEMPRIVGMKWIKLD